MAASGSGLARWIKGFTRPWPRVGPETFVLWEPCSKSHGEIVPGYTRYLLDLGFEVLVLMTPDRLNEGLFSRFDPAGVRHGHLTQRQIRRFMQRPELSVAAGVLITTAGKLPNTPEGRVDLDRVFGPVRPKPILLVEHDARPRIDAGVWDPRHITLRRLLYKGAQSIVVNPHDFGRVEVTPKSEGKTILTMVGAVRSKRGNLPLVHEAAMSLLKRGITAFEIRVIGKPGSEPVPEALRPHIKILGRLSFDALYTEIEAADFLLTSFQKDNPDHEFYRTGGTSGAFQLAFGFTKPIIVQDEFARLNGFNLTNALIYDADAELAEAMARAVAMDGGTYAALQAGMDAAATAIYEQSLAHLRDLTCD